jgi:hypothetical protein
LSPWHFSLQSSLVNSAANRVSKESGGREATGARGNGRKLDVSRSKSPSQVRLSHFKAPKRPDQAKQGEATWPDVWTTTIQRATTVHTYGNSASLVSTLSSSPEAVMHDVLPSPSHTIRSQGSKPSLCRLPSGRFLGACNDIPNHSVGIMAQ